MYTRSRSKGSFESVPPTGNWTQTAFNGTVQSSTSGGISALRSNGPAVVTTLDVEVPRFASRRAAGEVFCNAFSSVSEIRVWSDKAVKSRRTEPLYIGETDAAWQTFARPDFLKSHGSALQGVQGGGAASSEQFGYDIGALSVFKSRNAAQRDVAWNAALADMAKTNALLLVTAAELHKTLELLGDYALLLRGRLGRLEYLARSRGVGRGGVSAHARLIANEWLKVRYGVMTTVHEIQGVVEALSRPSKPPRVTARGKSSYTDTFTRQRTAVGSGVRPGFNVTSVTTVQGSVRAGILYEPLMDDLTTRLGLHPSVLPEVFFELTRLSFVANWFMDLSETIRAVNASLYGKSLCGWITETIVGETRHTASAGGPSTVQVFVNGSYVPTTWAWTDPPNGAAASSFFTIKTRTPVDGLSVKTPSVRVRVSLPRVADAFALIAQTLTQASAKTRGVRL